LRLADRLRANLVAQLGQFTAVILVLSPRPRQGRGGGFADEFSDDVGPTFRRKVIAPRVRVDDMLQVLTGLQRTADHRAFASGEIGRNSAFDSSVDGHL
jgi:hypothetical protein